MKPVLPAFRKRYTTYKYIQKIQFKQDKLSGGAKYAQQNCNVGEQVMPLPFNLDALLKGQIVEWERLEFKTGWNPESVVHTLCAFANDLHNWGGGYIVVGLSEQDGQPVLPPAGVNRNQLDKIQKELVGLCQLISPFFAPVVEPVYLQGQWILVIWAPGGDSRPYKAPVSLSKKSHKAYFVRRNSVTCQANVVEEQQLLEQTARVPFDDRIQNQAELKDLSLGLIQSFLQEVGSDLFEQTHVLSLAELYRLMQIARGPEEYLKPVNIGLLLFSSDPQRWFRGACIEVVIFDDAVGDRFREKRFSGPIQSQLKDALAYIESRIIVEEVRKIQGQIETLRFYNYPMAAIKEALANAVYHRSYERQNPIEVNIRPDQIEILSWPGPLPPLNQARLASGERVVAKDYRNRRIGDFLKELKLTEGRGTGFPKIRKAMARNGSPDPVFETDADGTYFLTVLPVHPEADHGTDHGTDQLIDTIDAVFPKSQFQILATLLTRAKNPLDIHGLMALTPEKNRTRFRQKWLKPLLDLEIIAMTLPNKPRSKLQAYNTTAAGFRLLQGYLLSEKKD